MAAMKHGHALGIGLLAMALVACGGSDGGGGSSTITDPNLGLTQDYRVEAVLTDPSIDPNYIYQDPLNLQVNDRVTFQLVYYTDSGTVRHVVPTSADTLSSLTGVTFTTSAPASTASRPSPGGELSESDGQFTAPTSDTGSTTYAITANYKGSLYPVVYRINPQNQQIRLRGRVLAQGTNVPVYNAVVDFYSPRVVGDATSRPVVIATVRTAFNGTFRASIRALNDSDGSSVSPLTFTIRRSALPSGSGTAFVYQGARYSLTQTDCRATVLGDDGLPFKSGERTLGDTILLATTSTDTTTGVDDGCSDATTTASGASTSLRAALAKTKGR